MLAIPTMKANGRPPNKCTTCGEPFKGHTCRGAPAIVNSPPWKGSQDTVVAVECEEPQEWEFEELERILTEEDGDPDPMCWEWSAEEVSEWLV